MILNPERVFTSVTSTSRLFKIFTTHGVPIGQFTDEKGKLIIEQLLRRLRKKKAILAVCDSQLVIVIRQVIVDMFYHLNPRVTHHLVESKYDFRGIPKKMIHGENSEDTARRCIREKTPYRGSLDGLHLCRQEYHPKSRLGHNLLLFEAHIYFRLKLPHHIGRPGEFYTSGPENKTYRLRWVPREEPMLVTI